MKEITEKIEDIKSTGPKKATLGIDENVERALCYIFIFFTGIFFLLVENKNKFVRLHALQSIAVFVPLFVIGLLISWIPNPFVSFWLLELLKEVDIIVWLFLMYKAYIKEIFRLPIAGNFAAKHAGI